VPIPIWLRTTADYIHRNIAIGQQFDERVTLPSLVPPERTPGKCRSCRCQGHASIEDETEAYFFGTRSIVVLPQNAGGTVEKVIFLHADASVWCLARQLTISL
jgi:hypothetical protein